MITESGSRQLFIARLSGDEEDAFQSRFVRLNLTAHLAPRLRSAGESDLRATLRIPFHSF